ncbi:MAG: hypothetical protein FRX48_03748 [Lasallia pustulata]|uniref:Uncharacterized protein n=1 Tax=Lasallia pustulata TaxID=136370 RepID=A0A5M8PT47_9LECA|nr:MAG: hypothetical protein FRX48_03748 [Lasallia pustulata]
MTEQRSLGPRSGSSLQPDMDFPTATGLAAETSVSRGAEESPLFFFTAKNPGIGVYGVRVSQKGYFPRQAVLRPAAGLPGEKPRVDRTM